MFLKATRGWHLKWTPLHPAARTPAHGLFMFETIVMVLTPQDCWAAITKYGRSLRATTKRFDVL